MADHHTLSRRVRTVLALILVTLGAAAGVVLGTASPAAAQPSGDLSSYVLFGFEELDLKGGQGNHGPSIIDGGNIGVNGLGFIRGNDFRMNICANAQVVMSDNTHVVSDTARMGDRSTPRQECDFNEAFVNTGAANNEDTRTGPAQPFTAPPVKATPDFPDYTCDPNNPFTVPAQGTATMTPGTYGNVNWQNGTTITLTAGTYTMCRITTGQHVTVITEPGVVLQVAQDFLINDDMSFDGSDCATIPQVYVRADGVGSSNNAVRFGQDSEIWGHFYVPDGKLNLGNQTTLHGTFWARAIGSDFNVDVEYCPPPHPPPETGDISVTKVLTGDVEGAPPGGTYTIHYDCEIPGPGVRNALDGSFDIVPGETLTFTDVQVGTTCVATEIDVPDPLPGYVFDPPVITPDTVVVEQPGQVVEVLVENPLREVFGTIEVTKEVSGETAGYDPGSRFGFELDCEDDVFDTTFELEAGETFTSEPIHVGVPCTVTETSTPDPVPGFIYGDPVFTPDPPEVTIAEENQVVTVRVDNPLLELVGRVAVRKTVTGDTDGYVQGSEFTFGLDCDDDAFDTRFTLVDDGLFTSEEIPVGTTCSVTETAQPDPASGFTWGAATFTPDPPTLTITTAGQVATIEVENQLTGPDTAPGTDTGPGTGNVQVPTSVPAGTDHPEAPGVSGPQRLSLALALLVGLALTHAALLTAARTRAVPGGR